MWHPSGREVNWRGKLTVLLCSLLGYKEDKFSLPELLAWSLGKYPRCCASQQRTRKDLDFWYISLKIWLDHFYWCVFIHLALSALSTSHPLLPSLNARTRDVQIEQNSLEAREESGCGRRRRKPGRNVIFFTSQVTIGKDLKGNQRASLKFNFWRT